MTSAIPAALLRPDETAFFLDVDGTLLGFKDNPNDVVADAPLLATLRALVAAADGAVALISGRTIADLDRIVAPLVLPVGGTHGAELRFADGRRETMTVDLSAPRSQIIAFVRERPGLSMEDKGNAIAVHYRRAPQLAEEVTAFLAEVAGEGELAIQNGKCVGEVKPRAIGKGRAIATLLGTPPFVGRRPVFMGDDLTDENGFEYVGTVGGVAVKVGSGETIAPYRIADPETVRNLLDEICRDFGQILV